MRSVFRCTESPFERNANDEMPRAIICYLPVRASRMQTRLASAEAHDLVKSQRIY